MPTIRHLSAPAGRPARQSRPPRGPGGRCSQRGWRDPCGHAGRRSNSTLGDERGFTLVEVMVACLVLVVGLLGLFATLNVAAGTTKANRQRQVETSLGREIIEDARTLAYTQLTPTTLAGALQPTVPGSSVAGQGLAVTRSGYTLDVAMNVCSLDDPTDGYGNHSSPPASGGVWCPDVAPNGTVDTNPDDHKRLTVTITPNNASQPAVQLGTLIYNQTVNGPAVSCLTNTSGSCPGTNISITSTGTSSLTFYVTTTTQAASVQWLVNGNTPPSAQIGGSATDPYVPATKTSSFTWVIPTRSDGTSIDGTYTISAYAQDSNGATGSRSVLQVTVNEHQATAPTSLVAGYDQQAGGVDVQWLPSTDQDVLYYDVYHQVNGSPVLVCGNVKGTSCTDPSASSQGTAPTGACTTTDYPGSSPNVYWVVGVDTYPPGSANAGQPRVSTLASPTEDASLCDHPPSAPSSLTTTSANGAVTLNWSAPPAPQDPDPDDGIQGWRIYRWASGTNASDPASRLAYVGAVNGSQTVTSFTDSSPDPSGVSQSYCVTAVDIHLNESTCSNVATG